MTSDGVRTPRAKARAVDWEDLRRRLARARAGLEGGGAVSAERRREIMAERTRRTAAEPVIAAGARGREKVGLNQGPQPEWGE
jgi:hypothetical protein